MNQHDSDIRMDMPDEAALIAFAGPLAGALRDGAVLYLRGDLGAGKTTLARAVLQQMGVVARIKSPTYSLIETYRLPGIAIHHLDLYRIADSAELEWLGLADLETDRATLLLIEWPDRGRGQLPPADLELLLEHRDPGRHLRLSAKTELGAACLARLKIADNSVA
ncbi:MAG: tRNA (adenosine(37)-N6)-threonylcarbamoyltransferase complex ATPase subunit type 1 TsaE [Tahibacter sp.]